MNTETIGQVLRSTREAMPASLYQASRETKIRVDFLESMERDNFRFLSGGTYVKGMLRAYARWLDLDDEAVAAEFDKVHARLTTTPIEKMVQEPAQPAPKSKTPHWVIAAGLAAAVLLVLSLVGVMSPVNEVAEPPDPNQQVAEAPAATSTSSTSGTTTSGVQFTVNIIGKSSWVRVVTDGNEAAAFEQTLFNGNSKTFDANRVIKVLIGNLGAVRVSVNGRDLGTPGPLGQVGTFEFTPGSTSFAGG